MHHGTKLRQPRPFCRIETIVIAVTTAVAILVLVVAGAALGTTQGPEQAPQSTPLGTQVIQKPVEGSTTPSPSDSPQTEPTISSIKADTGAVGDRLTEIIREDPEVDGVDNATMNNPAGFYSSIKWRGKCWYDVKNFCVVNGQLTMFHDPQHGGARKGSLRMCNEFSQHSKTIELKYHSEPLPEKLPGPVLTKTKGWILQFWCQDLFHMTLTLMPAFQMLQQVGPHPDVFIRIAKGVRKNKSQYCRIKLGDPASFELVKNPKWGHDKQFPFAGNPYWPFYRLLTPDPHRILPLYKGATKKTVCYREGIIDKFYLKELTGLQARNYSDAQLQSFGVTKGERRKCGRYRVTLIDRRGRTRRLNNTDEMVATIEALENFKVRKVALELLPIRDQLHLMTETDILLGVHGNGLTWLQFLEAGSVVVELVGIFYTPYALLFGHTHLHSSMANNMPFKRNGEYVPFPANLTELSELMLKAKDKLDAVACADGPAATPAVARLDTLYKSCAPYC